MKAVSPEQVFTLLVVSCALGAMVYQAWRANRGHVPAVPIVSEGATLELNERTPSIDQAVMVLVTTAVQDNAVERFWDVKDVTTGGYPMGDYRVTVEKTR